MKSGAQKLGTATALLIAAVTLSRLLGFVREAVVAGLFGATGATDAFYAAFTIPDMMSYFLTGGSLSITFIPLYTRHLLAGDETRGARVFAAVATTVGLVVLIAVLGLELATPAIADWYLDRMSPVDRALAVHLTRILLPAQLAFFFGGLAAATLYARRRFLAAAVAPVVYNLCTIAAGAALGARLGIAAMAWGTLAGALLGPFALQALAAGRAGLRFRPVIDLRDPDFGEYLRLSLPLIIGVSLVMADEWIIRKLAAGDLGVISCVSYARKLIMVPVAIAGQAVGQASLPFFARLFAENKREELGALVTRSTRASMEVAALSGAALIAVSVPLVDLLFRRGQFRAADVAPTAGYLSLFALAIPLWAGQGMLSRAFYAARDTLTPMLCGTGITVAMLPVYVGLQRELGSIGLVLASDVGIAVHTGVLLVLLPRVVAASRRSMLSGLGRASVLGAMAALIARTGANRVAMGDGSLRLVELAQVGVAAALFAMAAALLARPLGVSSAVHLLDAARRRLRA